MVFRVTLPFHIMGNYGKLAIHPLGPDVVMDLLNSWNLLQHWVMVSNMCLMSTIF